jgi:hypothetical protein
MNSSLPRPVTKSELVGTWKLDYAGKIVSNNPKGEGYGSEELILTADGNYKQRFDDLRGGIYPVTEGTWELTSEQPAGRQKIRMTNMRFYPDGVSNAQTSVPRETVALDIEYASNVPLFGAKRLILCFAEADLNLCFTRK